MPFSVLYLLTSRLQGQLSRLKMRCSILILHLLGLLVHASPLPSNIKRKVIADGSSMKSGQINDELRWQSSGRLETGCGGRMPVCTPGSIDDQADLPELELLYTVAGVVWSTSIAPAPREQQHDIERHPRFRAFCRHLFRKPDAASANSRLRCRPSVQCKRYRCCLSVLLSSSANRVSFLATCTSWIFLSLYLVYLSRIANLDFQLVLSSLAAVQ